MVDYNLWWKTSGLMEDYLFAEDSPLWKTTLVEDDLWWKMTLGGRRPSVQPSVDDDLCMLASPLCGIFIVELDSGIKTRG